MFPLNNFNYYLVIPIILIILRKLREQCWGKCKNNNNLDGNLVIVTGANSGIGYETVKELIKRNATVIMACRNTIATEKAINSINKQLNKEGKLIYLHLDLSNLKSIENFAKIIKKSFNKIDILINNAGVSYPYKLQIKTNDGYEINFGINHLGHFYLTNLLLNHLNKNARIIIVSSTLHERGIIDLNATTGNLYANSKLCNIYFARELSKRLSYKSDKNDNIIVLTVCPGWVYTNLFKHSIKWWHYIIISPIAYWFMRSSKIGAQTIIYCATENNLQSGGIYRDCKLYKSKYNFNDETGDYLWRQSEQLINKII